MTIVFEDGLTEARFHREYGADGTFAVVPRRLANLYNMKSESKRNGSWESNKQRLLQEGQMTRFRLSTSVLPHRRKAKVAKTPDCSQRKSLKCEGSDEVILQALELYQVLHSPTILHLGGRKDPFSTYPVKSNKKIQIALDYYTEVFSSIAVRGLQNTAHGKDTQFFQSWFGLLFQDPMLFEATIAMALTMQDSQQNPGAPMSREVLYHSAKALQQLQDRISSGGYDTGASDAVIRTIMYLMAINYFNGDFQAFKAHLVGVRHVVALRGGLDKMHFNGFIKAKILAFEAMSQQREEMETWGPSSGLLEYPSHPFQSTLCATLAKLPIKITSLALAGKLSIQIIGLIERLSATVEAQRWRTVLFQRGELTKAAVQASNAVASGDRGAEAAVKLFEGYGPLLTTLERLLAIACLAYCILFEEGHPPVPFYILYIQSQVGMLQESEIDLCDSASVVWVALVLSATMEKGEGPWKWAQRVLKEDQKATGSELEARKRWDQIESLFWPPREVVPG